MRTSLQIAEEKAQEMIRWSLDSVKLEQRQHSVEMFRPHDASLCLVGNLLRCVIHILKACFGIAPLNQTEDAQALTSLLGLKTSHVLEAEYPWHNTLSTTQQYLSSTEERQGTWAVVRWACRRTAGSDLGEGIRQLELETASCTLETRGKRKALGPSSPSNLFRGPRGVQESYQKLHLRPFPTVHLINFSAKGRRCSNDFQVQESAADSLIPKN